MADTTDPQTQIQALAQPEEPQPQMAETDQSQAQPIKPAQVSFSIWPPTERTRGAVTSRLVETLSTPSILSKRYGTMSEAEAVEAAKRIEAEAFDAAGGKAEGDGGDGIEVLQVYSKEISKRMLEAVKARSDGASADVAVTGGEEAGKAEA